MRTPGNRPLRALMAIDAGGPQREPGRRAEENGEPHELEQVRRGPARRPCISSRLLSRPAARCNVLTLAFPSLSPKFLDLVTQLLNYDPAKRITATEAIQHPFFEYVGA